MMDVGEIAKWVGWIMTIAGMAAADRQMEKFQLNSDGGLHKVTNISKGELFTTFIELYAP